MEELLLKMWKSCEISAFFFLKDCNICDRIDEIISQREVNEYESL